MQIDLVYPTLPPSLDGIGDYTSHLARTLSEKQGNVRILTSQKPFTPMAEVDVVPSFSTDSRRGILSLYDAVAARPPEWLVVQFEQFSYGRWGLNPYLPLVLRRIKQAIPETRIALMAHEDFVSATESPQFAIMSLWQRPQFWALGHLADHIFLSIEAWARRYRRWFPDTPVNHLPVGSNIPRVGRNATEARRQFDLPEDAFIVGMFGGAHPSRQLDRISVALRALHRLHPTVCALYVGAEGSAFRQILPDAVSFYDLGPLPAEDVSAAFETMDLYLAPFQDGVSTRRGSFLVGLQHEIPTLSTYGRETDDLLLDVNEEAFILVPWADPAAYCAAAERLVLSPNKRAEMGKQGKAFFDRTFSWSRIANQLLAALSSSQQNKQSVPEPSAKVSAPTT